MEGSFVTTQSDNPNENPTPGTQAPTPASNASPPILPYFLRVKKVLGILAVLGALAGGIPKLIAPKTYTAGATLSFPPPPNAKLLGAGAEKDYPGLPLFEGASLVPQPGTVPATAQLILTSRKTIGALVDEFKFAKEWGVPRDVAIKSLMTLIVFRPGEVGDLKIEYTDPNRQRSKQMVSRLLEILSGETARVGRDFTGNYLTYIEDERAKAEATLKQNLVNQVAFLNKTDPLPPADMASKLGDVYVQLLSDEFKGTALAASKEALVNRLTAAATDIINKQMDPNLSNGAVPSLLSSLYQKRVESQAKLNLLLQSYNETYPDVVLAKRDLTEVNRNLAAETLRLLKSIQSGDNPYIASFIGESVAAQTALREVKKAETALKKRLDAMPARAVSYALLQAEVEASKDKVTFWRTQEMKALVISGSRGHTFAIVDPPDAPEQYNPRGLLMGTVLGVFVALFFGSFYPYYLWYKDLPKDGVIA